MKICNLCLRCVAGPRQGTLVRFDGVSRIMVGSSADADVCVFDDPHLEPHHFQVVAAATGIEVEDLSSTHGVLLNGRRIDDRALIQDGDAISAGESEWLISVTEAADANQKAEESTVDAVLLSAAPRLHRMGYELVRELDHGAFARVFLARRISDRQEVAIKVLATLPVSNTLDLELFVRETKVLRSLEHPNIVRLWDVGAFSDEVAWYCMEFVPGLALDRLIARDGPLPIRNAVLVACEVLEALAYAHQAPPPGGPIVHRDLQPGNVLLYGNPPAWKVKLVDFGMAKNFEQAGMSHITRTGEWRGTLEFMSPDQATDSKYIGPEGDLFAVGALLYYALTGRFMYGRTETTSELVRKIAERAIVPLRSHRNDIPPDLERLFERAVGLDGVRRFRSAQQFLTALKQSGIV